MQACVVEIAGLFSGSLEAFKFYDEASNELYLYFKGENLSEIVFKNLGKSADIEIFESQTLLGKFELFTSEQYSFTLRRDLTEDEIKSFNR